MHIKIYSGEKTIYLADEMTDELTKLSGQADTLVFPRNKKPDALLLVKELTDTQKNIGIIVRKNLSLLKNNFFTGIKITAAGGGIVLNEKKDILFIFRKGKWDLPKGKLDAGETIEACAAREIEEETGVKNLTLKRKVGDTHHLYTERGKNILKLSHWFYFTCSGKQVLKPQPEEDITEVKWIPTRRIKEPMDNTYKTIRDIMTEFFDTP